jgi:hypothetical protein
LRGNENGGIAAIEIKYNKFNSDEANTEFGNYFGIE